MFDTPTRAQRCGRPQTRRWKELMRAARSDEAEAMRLRAELNRYLSTNDTQAAERTARRAARSAAAQMRRTKKDGGEVEERRPPTKSTEKTPEVTPAIESTSEASSAIETMEKQKSTTTLNASVVKTAAVDTKTAPIQTSKTTTEKTSGTPTSIPTKKRRGVPSEPQAEQGEDPEFADWTGEDQDKIEAALLSLSTPWTERVSALRAIASSTVAINSQLAKSVAVQLGDLRSRVVVEASNVVKTRTHSLAIPDALHIASSALNCVAVKKAVMADARESAVIASLSPLYDNNVAWTAVLKHVQSQPTERARASTVRAVIGWIPSVPSTRDTLLGKVLGVALGDRAPSVREAAKLLFASFKKHHDVKRTGALREGLPPSVRGRLPTNKAKSANSGKLSLRDAIKAKRAAMASEKRDNEEVKVEVRESKTAGFGTTPKGLGDSSTSPNVIPKQISEPAKKKIKLNSVDQLVGSDKENRVEGQVENA